MKLFTVNAAIIFLGYILMYFQNGSETDLVSPFFSYLISIVIVFIPLVIFGSSTPVIIALMQEMDNSPSTGKVFSNSTIGGILFSLLTGYFLIDTFGVGNTILLAVILCSLMPLSYFLKAKQNKALIVTSLLPLFSLIFMSTKPVLPETEGFKTLHFSEGITGQLIVADFLENKEETRILLINRMGQTKLNLKTNFSGWPYVNYLTSAASIYPEGSRTLVLGLGGGMVPRQISHYLKHNVDAVEIDQRIIDLSEEYFNNLQARINSYNDDARRFVKSVDAKYDFIVLDIFNGEIMPSHGLSKEAFSDIERILNPGGLIAINFNGFLSGKEGAAGRSLIKTLKSAGFNLSVFDCSAGKDSESQRNLIYFAYKVAPNWKNAKVHTVIAGKEYKISEHLMSFSEIPSGISYLITDDKPVLEYINRYAADSWRKDYLKHYTKKFRQKFQLPLVR
jgi:predicted membrane-bound spermidine synthase